MHVYTAWLQAPVERVLGLSQRVRGGEIKECCHDIPLLESLQALLKNETVVDQVRQLWHNALYVIQLTISGF